MNNFSFLPQSKNSSIIFIDSCVLGNYIQNYSNPNEIKRDIKRFKNLTTELSKRDWLIIPEVVEEFKEGIDSILSYKHSINLKNNHLLTKRNHLKQTIKTNKKINNLIQDYINLKQDFCENHLKQEFRNASSKNNLTDYQFKRINEILDFVEPIFLKNNEIPHKRNKDCKLIATALVYAESKNPKPNEKVFLFSYDKPLLNTFAESTKTLDLMLAKTYVITQTNAIIPCWKYNSKIQ